MTKVIGGVLIEVRKNGEVWRANETIQDWILNKLYDKLEGIHKRRKESELRSYCVCKGKVHFFDTTKIVNERNRASIKIGQGSYIRGEIHTFGISGEVKIGEDCFVGEDTRIWSAKGIEIGDRCLISHQCNIIDNDTHPKDSKARYRQFKAIVSKGNPRIDLNGKKIVIEDDVLICANCIILKGCKIGKRSIIGAGTVVNRDIPSDCIAYGNPLIIKELEVGE